MTRFLITLLSIMLTACAGAPVERQPQALKQAQDADKNARRALRNDELLRARQFFTETLVLRQSLDDTAGAAITQINLATVDHRLHDDEAALSRLDTILLESAPVYSPEARMEAAFRKAVILADLARFSEADSALQFSEELCARECPLRYGIDVLRARLCLLNGDAERALLLAQAVSDADKAEKEEQANALRIAATSEEKLARYATALQHFQAALEIDKTLNFSVRIGEDLEGMARVSARLGHNREASLYARRARLVNEAYRQRGPK